MELLRFTDKRLSYRFSLATANEHILLEKIIFDDFLGDLPNVWSRKVVTMDPFLYLEFKKSNGNYQPAPVSVDALISTMHFKPVLYFYNFQKLHRNTPRPSNWPGYYDELIIKIDYKPQDDVPLNLSLYYEASPGVFLIPSVEPVAC